VKDYLEKASTSSSSDLIGANDELVR
jgi:hypothetical protein